MNLSDAREEEINVCIEKLDIDGAKRAGIMLMRAMIEREDASLEEAFARFQSVLAGFVTEAELTAMRRKLAEKYPTRRGSYDTETKSTPVDSRLSP